MKIAVLGMSGGGKSTFSRTLAQLYGVPVLHLDVVHYLPNWQVREKAEANEIVNAFLDLEGWVVDGNYRGYEIDRRLRDADRVYLLLLPRSVCLKAALKRYRDHRGTTREDVADGCIEKFDFSFLWWIMFGGRTHKRMKWYRDIEKTYPEKTVILRSREEIDRCAAALKSEIERGGKENR